MVESILDSFYSQVLEEYGIYPDRMVCAWLVISKRLSTDIAYTQHADTLLYTYPHYKRLIEQDLLSQLK